MKKIMMLTCLSTVVIASDETRDVTLRLFNVFSTTIPGLGTDMELYLSRTESDNVVTWDKHVH